MNYIALSATQLSRFSHHWFWGLCVNNKQGYSLCDAALALQHNIALRQATEASVDGFNQRPWLIRSLCWLLNYRQYRFHYYQLQGYWSWQLYQKGVTMFSKPNQSGIVTGGFIVTATSLFTNNVLPVRIRSSLKWFSSKVRSLMVNKNLTTLSEMPFPVESALEAELSQLIASSSLPPSEQIILNNPESIPTFIVQAAMLPKLTTLGIIAQVDESIALSRLKSAYNLSRLQTHPDKAGDQSHLAFLAVTQAYDTLITLIEEQSSQAGLQSNSSVFDELGKMRQEISIMNQKISIMNQKISIMNQDITIMREDNIQMQMEIKQNNIELQKIAEEIIRQEERKKKQQIREKELQMREKEQEELEIQLKQNRKTHIININKTHNFPELTEETLQAYCTDPDSFIKKVRDHQMLSEKNTESTSHRQAKEELSPTHSAVVVKSAEISASSTNNVVFFGKPTQNPPSQNDKVQASCACFK